MFSQISRPSVVYVMKRMAAGYQLCLGCMFFGSLLLEIHRLNRWLKPLEFVGMVYVANNIEMIEITKLSIVEDVFCSIIGFILYLRKICAAVP
ncbi:hypothetical protein P8452_56800 [Trifolium repens]|nr:hypothetical protein P8452_56800 [Trifolium repens]